MIQAVTVPLADLNELERIEASVKRSGELIPNCGRETFDTDRSEGVLGEEVTRCEGRRSDDDDVESIDVVEC